MSTIYVTTVGSPVTETVFASAAATIEASSIAPDGSTVYQTVFTTEVLSFIPIEPTTKSEKARCQSSNLSLLRISAFELLAQSCLQSITNHALATTTTAGTAKPYSGVGTNGWNGTTFTTTSAGSAAVTPGHSTTPSIGISARPFFIFEGAV